MNRNNEYGNSDEATFERLYLEDPHKAVFFAHTGVIPEDREQQDLYRTNVVEDKRRNGFVR